MKTKNNVQKAILRSGAVVVSFVLISFTVSAQDFWKRVLTNSSFNEIALAMVETSGETETPESNDASTYSYLMEEELEESLDLESWMVNENNFDATFLFSQPEQESHLELEDWMLNENLFQPETEVEESLELEAWMVSDKVWNM